MKLTIGLLLIVTLSSGCVMTGQNSCAGFKPIIMAGQSIDGLTDQDAREVLAHNEFGKAQGCWE